MLLWSDLDVADTFVERSSVRTPVFSCTRIRTKDTTSPSASTRNVLYCDKGLSLFSMVNWWVLQSWDTAAIL